MAASKLHLNYKTSINDRRVNEGAGLQMQPLRKHLQRCVPVKPTLIFIMKFLLSLLILLTSFNAKCQTHQLKILGKWKILSLNDRDVYYNFKTDSAILKGLNPTEKQDTAIGMQNLRQTMAIMKNTSFVFGRNGNLNIIRQDSTQNAKYKIMTSNGKTKLTYNRIGDAFVDSFYVTIKKNFLFLKSIDDPDFKMIFEKD